MALEQGVSVVNYQRDGTIVNNIENSGDFVDFVDTTYFTNPPFRTNDGSKPGTPRQPSSYQGLFRRNKYDTSFDPSNPPDTYTREELLAMSPQQLSDLMDTNAKYSAVQSEMLQASINQPGGMMNAIGGLDGFMQGGSFSAGVRPLDPAKQDAGVIGLEQVNSRLIDTGTDGAAGMGLTGSPLERYQTIKSDPDRARRAVQSQAETNLEREKPDLIDQIVKGAVLSAVTAGFLGPLGAVAGAEVGGVAGTVIGSGAATGAASGALTSVAMGSDPLMGAIKGGVAGFVLGDLGVKDWLMDKAAELTGSSPSNVGEAVSMIGDTTGQSSTDIISGAGEIVHGPGFNPETDLDMMIQTDGGNFAYDWDSGQLVSGVDGGVAESVLGPGAALGAGSALAGTAPGQTPQLDYEPNTGNVTNRSDTVDSIMGTSDNFAGSGSTGGSEDMASEGSGNWDVEKIAKALGIGIEGAAAIIDYFGRQEDGQKALDAYMDGMDRVDPWGNYRGQYASQLNDFMAEGRPPIPTRPAGIEPLWYTQQNPYQSTSGMNEFLSNTQTPLEHQQQNPFVSQSGLLDLLKDPSSIKGTPAYEWRLNQGMEALDRQIAATGGRFSGGRMTALTDYAQGAASQEFENEFNRRNQYYGNELNLYNSDANRYTGNYNTEFAARQGAEQINRNQYDMDMNRYQQQYGDEYDRWAQDYDRTNERYVQDFNQLVGLAGATTGQTEGGNYLTSGQLAQIGQGQEARGDIASGSAALLDFIRLLAE